MKKPGFSHIEPAHPMQVKLREDLYYIYSQIREKFQVQIDKAFDNAARQIGFVMTTSLPVTLKIEQEGRITDITFIHEKQLQDTVFEKALKPLLDKMRKDPFPKEISRGEYTIYLFWFEALKLKLKTDWIEPAHHGSFSKYDILKYRDLIDKSEIIKVGPDVIEPVHWFDALIPFSSEELIMIHVIDEVYPDLKLFDKITYTREKQRKLVFPEVTEPAHFKPEQGLEFGKLRQLVNELNNILVKFGY